MNYIQKARELLASKINVESELLDVYTLLVFTKGENTTREDVHNAWSVWRNTIAPEDTALIPFHELSKEIQEEDSVFMEAIRATAHELQS